MAIWSINSLISDLSAGEFSLESCSRVRSTASSQTSSAFSQDGGSALKRSSHGSPSLELASFSVSFKKLIRLTPLARAIPSHFLKNRDFFFVFSDINHHSQRVTQNFMLPTPSPESYSIYRRGRYAPQCSQVFQPAGPGSYGLRFSAILIEETTSSQEPRAPQ